MNSEFTIALHGLVLLAYRPDHMATSETIADNVCTHPARVRKVMSCLKKQGYLSTKEGSGGGFALNCDPAEVTLAEIYRVTSMGSIKPSWCSGDEEEDCMISRHMSQVMQGVYAEAEQGLLASLQGLTVMDMLERVREVQRKKT